MPRTTFNDNLNPYRNQLFFFVYQWNLDASAFKFIPIRERVTLRFNMDFFNILNHPNNTTTIGGDGIQSLRNSGTAARVMQLTLRLSW